MVYFFLRVKRYIFAKTKAVSKFLNELKWRGMLHDFIPGCEEVLEKQSCIGYIGFDPTADSLHIGSLVQKCWRKNVRF